MTGIHAFIEEYYRHFNAGQLREAARAYVQHIRAGGRMFLSLAGAMSTAEVGKILAPAIRNGLIHGISCTGANLEEDMFRLVGGRGYHWIPEWQTLAPETERRMFEGGISRVTDTGIPEPVMAMVEDELFIRWEAAANSGRSAFPVDFMFDLLRDPALQRHFQDTAGSWLLAAEEKNIPIWTPGWEDSSTGNAFTAAVLRGDISRHDCVRPGTEAMATLVRWYMENCDPAPGIGFLQVGGGIAGDFAICVTPLILKELQLKDTPLWGYFCQITDAVPTYGGYSGAPPNEKITWGKVHETTPRYSINSDATIVLPLLLAYVLDEAG